MINTILFIENMASSQTTTSDSNEATMTSDVTSDITDDVTIAPPSYESACASGTLQGASGMCVIIHTC